MDLRCPDCHRTRCLCNLADDPTPALPDPLLPYRRWLYETEQEAREAGCSPADYRRSLQEDYA